MDKGLMAVILFCIISVGIAYLVHRKVEVYIFACILAALISSGSYQLIGYFVLGYLDPFFLIALAAGAGVAFLLALLAGIPVVYNRKKNKKKK